MSLPKFGYQNFLDFAAVLSASSAQAAFPVKNLRDRYRFTEWRSNTIVDASDHQFVRFDLGVGVASRPNYVCIIDPDQTNAKFLGLEGSDDNFATTPYAVSMASPAGRFVSWYDVAPPADRRYWQVAFRTVTGGTVCSAKLILVGKAYTMSEGMAQGFDPDMLTPKYRFNRSKGGVSSGNDVDQVVREIALRLGPAGLPISEFAPGAKGVTATPCLDRFLRSYYMRGAAFAFHWVGPMTTDAWCHPEGKVSMPFISSTRRGLKMGFHADVDGYNEKDA